jgi:hypothetical protein
MAAMFSYSQYVMGHPGYDIITDWHEKWQIGNLWSIPRKQNGLNDKWMQFWAKSLKSIPLG